MTGQGAVGSLRAHRHHPLHAPSPQALSHAPRLRSLVLNACCKVSDRGLLALTRCASLRQLSVDRCPQLSGAALAALQRRLVLLRLSRPLGAAARPAAGVAEY